MLRILHINKSLTNGGAALAAFRLFTAQKQNGAFEYRYFAQQKENQIHEEKIVYAGKGYLWEKMGMARLAYEKFLFLFHERNARVRFQYSMANTGIPIDRFSFFREADIFHLHWICQGFLSLKGLEAIFRRGKPVIWTLHDMWPFTGGCHYAGGCERLGKGCGFCPMLRTCRENDISRRQCLEKAAMYKNARVTFVAPSHWMAEKVRSSFLGHSIRCVVIPNTLDTSIFAPYSMTEARKEMGLPQEGFCLLFGAVNTSEERKGFSMLIEALAYMKYHFPGLSQRIFLAIFGKTKEKQDFPFPVFRFEYITDIRKLVSLYNSANVFLLPSLEDNLPNTVMEALSCGTPVVAFRSGGVTDMVDHEKTGFLAQSGDTGAFAEGIVRLLTSERNAVMRENCRTKILKDFPQQLVVERYDALYRQIAEK